MLKSAIFLWLVAHTHHVGCWVSVLLGLSCTATGQQKRLITSFGVYSNCNTGQLKKSISDIFQHPEIYYKMSSFLGCRCFFHFPNYKSQKKPRHWRITQTCSFCPPQRWTKKPWHKWVFYLRYLLNSYWKHIAPHSLNHNKNK